MIFCIIQTKNNTHMSISSQSISQNFNKNQTPAQLNIDISQNQDPQRFRQTDSPAGKSFQLDNQLSEIVSSYQFNFNSIKFSNDINQHVRAKARLWILKYCSNAKIYRKTCAAACSLFDLCLTKNNLCQKQNLHQFAICCLKISNKLQENIQITIDENVFPKALLCDIQKKICYGLKFYLNPKTHLQILQDLLYLWEQFCNEKIEYQISSFIHSNVQVASVDHENIHVSVSQEMFKHRISLFNISKILLFQFLDLVLLIPKNLYFNKEQLSLNCFFFIYSIGLFQQSGKVSFEQVILNLQKVKKMYNPQHMENFQSFIKYCSSHFENEKIGLDLKYGKLFLPIYNAMISELDPSQRLLTNSQNQQEDDLKYQSFFFKKKYQAFCKVYKIK